MNFDHLPEEMRRLRQWVAWTNTDRHGKRTKLPISPTSGKPAATDDPSTWGTFDQAVRAGKPLFGIGFVFTADDPYCGLDMDGHVDMDLIRDFGSYAERSQSGKGAHIIVRARIGTGHKNARYEIYDRGRFFVMTGDVLLDAPIADVQAKVDEFVARVFPPPPPAQGVDLSAFVLPRPAPRDDLLARIRASAQGAKFEKLWSGDRSGYGSASEADAALLSILYFWTGGDQAESFRLFAQSGLVRPKWTGRDDYRQRTWQKIAHGEVYRAPAAASPALPNIVAKPAAPWRAVRIDHVMEAIRGSVLEPMVEAMRAPMAPPLPPEVGLMKSLALCGCALSEKRDEPRGGGNLAAQTARASALARVRILTSGGQVSNFMTLIVAESAVGKDIGGILDQVTHRYNWCIGTAGSEEGLADAYIARPNGLVNISEMRNWLDKRHWQSKAAGFLTHAFNKGWFVNAMSKRKESPLRESNYCYPNVLAEIQPGPLQQFAGTEDIETGFLGRFLIASAVANDDCPVCSDLQAEVRVCMNSVEALRALDCDVRVPDAYSRPLTGIFHKHGAKPASSWKRICNEYYPRLALILSVRPDNTDPQIVITEKAWAGARIMCQYFFGQAEAVLNRVFDDPAQARFERICERIYTIIRNAGSTGVLVRDISHLCGMGTKSKDRREALEELLDRGTITEMKLPNGTRYFAG